MQSYGQPDRPLNDPFSRFCRLVKEASVEAKQSGERGLTARSVRKVTAVSLLSIPKRI